MKIDKFSLPQIIILIILRFLIRPSVGSGFPDSDHSAYCYSADDEQCGHSSAAWGDTCQRGKSQSPIDISNYKEDPVPVYIAADAYQGSSFEIQNDGKRLSIRFPHLSHRQDDKIEEKLPSTSTPPFRSRRGRYGSCADHPTPLLGHPKSYRFVSADFHWGPRNNAGTEHTFVNWAYAMEVHLVHYHAKYGSLGAAISSGEERAVAVIAVILELETRLEDETQISEPGPMLTITNHLGLVLNAGEDWIPVTGYLDLTPWFKNQTKLFNYDGSFTAPACEQVVDWYVLEARMPVWPKEVDAFRKLFDKYGGNIETNIRPTQERNGRTIRRGSVGSPYQNVDGYNNFISECYPHPEG